MAAPARSGENGQSARPSQAMTPKEAAYELLVSTDTILRWCRQRILRGTHPGGPRCAIEVSEESVRSRKARPYDRAGTTEGQSPAGLDTQRLRGDRRLPGSVRCWT